MIKAVKKTFSQIGQYKTLFLILIITQLIFFSLFSAVNVYYQTKALQHSKYIIEYLEENEPQAEDLKSLLGKDPLLIYDNIKKITYNITILVILSLIIFIILNGSNWALTDQLIHKKDIKTFLSYLKNFAIITFIYIVPAYFIVFLNLKNSFTSSIIKEQSLIYPGISSLLLLIIIFYFLFISYSLIYKNSLKDIFKKTFIIGIKKFYIVLPIYLINIIIISIFAILLFLSIEKHIIVLTLSILLFTISVITTRLFLINNIKKIEKD